MLQKSITSPDSADNQKWKTGLFSQFESQLYDSASLYTEVESQKEEILKKKQQNHSKIIMSSSEHVSPVSQI